MTFTKRHDNATLVPPLQLARRDAGETYNFPGCEPMIRHLSMAPGSNKSNIPQNV